MYLGQRVGRRAEQLPRALYQGKTRGKGGQKGGVRERSRAGAKVSHRVGVARDRYRSTGVLKTSGREPMMAKKEGRGVISGGRAPIGPSDGRCVVTPNCNLLVRRGMVMSNGSGVHDNGGEFEVRVSDGARRIIKADQLALERVRDRGPPNIGPAPGAGQGGLAKPHTPHPGLARVRCPHTARGVGDKGVDGGGMCGQGCGEVEPVPKAGPHCRRDAYSGRATHGMVQDGEQVPPP